jgi:DNA polymerase/3'-5' exonuclease PolX
MKLQEAMMKALLIKQALAPLCERIEVAGSIRRECPEVHDIDIVLIPREDMMADIRALCLDKWAAPGDNILSGDDKKPKWGERMATFWHKGDTQVDLYFADAHTWNTLLLIRTGSKEHNIKLCSTAKSKGMYLAADGSGLFADRLKEKPIRTETEADIFDALGFHYVEPQERSY